MDEKFLVLCSAAYECLVPGFDNRCRIRITDGQGIHQRHYGAKKPCLRDARRSQPDPNLYAPKKAKQVPLIVWIHGGAFLFGSKEGSPVEPVPLDLLLEGYAVASIDYRLSPEAVFPAQLEDCKAAIRWLRAHAEEFGIDPNRIGVWGASAGGDLAALLGTTGEIRDFEVGENLGYSGRVQAVCDFFGPTDFLQMDAHRLPDGQIHNVPDSPES